MNVGEPASVLMINALLLFFLALYFFRKKAEPFTEILLWLMLAAGWWSLFYGFELTVKNERFLHLLFSVKYPAVFTLPLFWLIFSIRLTGYKPPEKFHISWLFLLPIINWILLLSNPNHHLFYKSASISTTSTYSYVEFDPGPALIFSHLIYSNIIVGAGLVLLLRAFALTKGIARNKLSVMILAVTLPFILNFAWILGFRPYGFLDTTPFGFTILGILIVAVFDRLSEFELRPLVLDSLLEHQPDALLATDVQSSRLLYSNILGTKLFELLSSQNGIRHGLEYLSKMPNNYGVSIGNRHYQVLVKDFDEGEAGRRLKLFSFRDVSELKQHETNLSALTQLTTTFGNDAIENIGKLLALMGEIFGADACFYNKKVGPMLITEASWNAPPGYQDVDRAEGHICNDVIIQNRPEPVIQINLKQSSYFHTDPNVRRYELDSYLGVVVRNEGKPIATLCLVFVQKRDFTENEQQFLNLISYVVANEESRQIQLQKLNEAKVNLRAILENSLDSIWSVDSEFRITYVNEVFKAAYRSTFNIELSEGVRIIDTLPVSLQPIWRSRYEQALKGEHFIFLDSVPVSNDQSFYIEVSVMPIIVEGRVSGISFFGRNITDKYLAEQRLRQSEQRLAELNAAKDRLFSIISHDLVSPFNNIIGLSEVIEEMADEAGNQTLREYAASILRVSKNTFAMLENLLHWSRAQSGKMQLLPVVVSLTEVVAQEIEFQRHRLDQKLINVVNKVDFGHAVMADALSVAVMVRNLISNAIKFSYTEGEIVIQTEKLDGNVLLRVQDYGCGISVEDQKSLFQIDRHPSRRGTQNETGTGLGLMLCKELAEKNGGHLLVQSRTGKGSTFTLVLRAALANS